MLFQICNMNFLQRNMRYFNTGHEYFLYKNTISFAFCYLNKETQKYMIVHQQKDSIQLTIKCI